MGFSVDIKYQDHTLAIRKVTFITSEASGEVGPTSFCYLTNGALTASEHDTSDFVVEQHNYPEFHFNTGADQLTWFDEYIMHDQGNDWIDIVVSNSEHIFNGIRIAVMRGYIAPEDVAAYFLKKDGSVVPVEIERDGRVKVWPQGLWEALPTALATLAKGQKELREKASKV